MAQDSSGEIRVNRIKVIRCPKGHEVDISEARPMSTIPCPHCKVNVRVPCQISHYLLVKPLARGRCGAVYQAYDEVLARQVALKILYQNPEADPSQDLAAEAIREAQTLAAINDSHVVQVYALDEDMGQQFVVMELVDGGRVDQLIVEGKGIEELRALRIGADTALGLAAANRLGRTHGDIKPQNILLARDGTAKLVDFGLSVRLHSKVQDAKFFGTPYYIAPEILRGEAVDHRADMYSLGATIFHLLVGRPPFIGGTPKQIMDARLAEPAPDPMKHRKVQKATAALVRRLMALNPADRYPSMLALAADLNRLANV